jgi:superfamily II DNA or RNA helicase
MGDLHPWPTDLWDHQRRGCNAVLSAIANRQRRIVLTSPTGMGKSRMMMELIKWAVSRGEKSALYTHRRLLCSQIARDLDAHQIQYGIRASGYKPNLAFSTQLVMTQSEIGAVFRRESRTLHNADLVLSDEIHAQGGDMLPTIHKQHYEKGAAICAVSATPLDLDGEWDTLIIAGNNSEGRKCGALVPAYTYCPDEPDLKHIKKYRIGEDLPDRDNAKLIMRPGIFGRVLSHWQRINPRRIPTLLFAPDVAGSIFFAQQLHSHGVRAAHIDAKQIWHDGEFMESDDDARQTILKMTETGEVEVLCNRFLLREAINLPHIGCGILATVFGSLKSYIQAVGRILRASPGLTEVSIIDHGANFRRHGSPNADRAWKLGMKGCKETGLRMEGMREHPETEPIRCPACSTMRLSGATCPKCGFMYHKNSRMVVEVSGDLKLVEGPAYKPHRVAMKKDTLELWKRYFFGARKKDRTFNQAMGWMEYNEHYQPPRNLPFMPIDPSDWFERISDLWPAGAPFPKDRLREAEAA